MADTTCPGEPGFECVDGTLARGLCKRCYGRFYARRQYQVDPERGREKSRQFRERHPEKVKASHRRWREANPEYDRRYYETNRDRVREKNRRWYEANKDWFQEYHRRWDVDNREKRREITRRWREAHPEYQQSWLQANRYKAREQTRRYRARKRDALTVPFTDEQLAARMTFWGNRCWICGGPFEEVDHVIALSRGGAHCLANLRPACRRCNRTKHNHDWREIQGEVMEISPNTKAEILEALEA